MIALLGDEHYASNQEELIFEVELPRHKNQIFTLNVSKRVHFQVYRKVKNEFRENLSKILDDIDVRVFTKLSIRYILDDSSTNRLDLDNALSYVKKFTSDLLVEYGFMPDDNINHLVKNVEETGQVGQGKVRVIMRQLDDPTVTTYQLDIPKLNKNNHLVINKEIFWISKKDERGKPVPLYTFWNVSTKKLYTAIPQSRGKDTAIEMFKNKYKELIMDGQSPLA